jgi:hypothetical protein
MAVKTSGHLIHQCVFYMGMNNDNEVYRCIRIVVNKSFVNKCLWEPPTVTLALPNQRSQQQLKHSWNVNWVACRLATASGKSIKMWPSGTADTVAFTLRARQQRIYSSSDRWLTRALPIALLSPASTSSAPARIDRSTQRSTASSPVDARQSQPATAGKILVAPQSPFAAARIARLAGSQPLPAKPAICGQSLPTFFGRTNTALFRAISPIGYSGCLIVHRHPTCLCYN